MTCWLKVIIDRIPKLIKTFLMIHVGTKDTAVNTIGSIKADYEILERKLKGIGAHVVFSLILHVRGKTIQQEQLVTEVNYWLC